MEQAMTDDNLPPLPRPGHLKVHTDSEGVPYWDEPLYTATQVEEIRRAAVLAERDRFRAMFDEALSDHSITWPGEVDILYEKMFPAAAIREGVK